MNRYGQMFRQIVRYAILGNLVVSALLSASSAMADLNVGPGETYTVTGIETVGALDVEGTLIVESTGSLTFTSRSEVDGPDPGGHIIVNGGSIVGHARFDTNKTATITMNGGSFRVNNTFKFPDNAPGPVYIYLNAGVLSSQDIQTMPDRNPHFIVGGGILRLDGDVEGRGQQYDPREWINLGIMVPAEGYDEIAVEYVETGGYTEVRAISADLTPSVAFASSTGEGSESYSQVNIPVSLSGPVGMTVTVNYAVTGGTATSVDDYTLTAGTLTFDPGQVTPETITLMVVNDGAPEPDETVVITLSDPTNAQLGNDYQLTYTIWDSSPAISFVTDSSQAAETDSPVNITVMSPPFEEMVTVNYAVVGGSADGGIDYILDAGVLQFDPLVEKQSISIALVDDGLEETPDETIVIALSDPSVNAKLGSFTTHTLTILPGVTGPCPKGDLNSDCRISVLDLQILGGQWLDEQGLCSEADPGCANLDGVMGVNMNDFVTLSRNWLEVGTTVVINEVMASNGTTISDPQEPDEQPDWFEIYNPGVNTVELGGMYMTNENDFPTKWRIPDDISITPGECKLFWADRDDEQGDYHTNFKLDVGGDNISLYASDGMTLIDTIDFRDYSQATDISYGRYPDGSGDLRYLSSPTPGLPNSGAYTGAVADTKFSRDRGFYDAAFNMVITCDTPGATIKYTTDGTKPSQGHGSTFSGPISIGSTTCIRAMAYKAGWLNTNVDTHTYIFGSSGGQKAIPTLSMVGISGSRGGDGTPVSLELIYPEELLAARQADWKGFQSDCETADHSINSYRLRWKTELGDSKLNYPFFEAAPVAAEITTDQFDRIVLRGGKNTATTYLGDPWVQISEKEMTGFGCNSMFMHLFQNGNYVGIVNPKERPDAWMWSSHYGGDFDDYFVLNQNFEPNRGNRTLSGDRSRFDQMMGMGGLGDYNNYQTFMTLCDVSHFADYTILFWYSGFGDGCDNNYYGGMRTNPVNGEVPPEGFKMMMWDGEFCFTNSGGPSGNEVPWVPDYYDSAGAVIPNIWNKLRSSGEFMMLFADRIYEHLYNDGALTDTNSWGRWSKLTADVTAAGASPGSVNSNMQGFANIFINAVRSAGYYPNVDPPSFQHGGIVSPGFDLSMSGSGTIYYTLDGTDPQAVGGGAVGTLYFGPISLNKSTRIKTRAYNGQWSALHEAVFGVGPVRESLRITEIMYHPTDPAQQEKDAAGDQTLIDKDFEYIELKNIGDSAINLNLVQFTDGIDFTFGDYSLGPGQFAVIVKNTDAFQARYPGVSPAQIAGTYTGSLDNGGEEIVMRDAIGTEIHDFNYRDSWFDVTDGGGYSLNKLDPDTSSTTAPDSWDDQSGWQSGSTINGTPGADE